MSAVPVSSKLDTITQLKTNKEQLTCSSEAYKDGIAVRKQAAGVIFEGQIAAALKKTEATKIAHLKNARANFEFLKLGEAAELVHPALLAYCNKCCEEKKGKAKKGADPKVPVVERASI